MEVTLSERGSGVKGRGAVEHAAERGSSVQKSEHVGRECLMGLGEERVLLGVPSELLCVDAESGSGSRVGAMVHVRPRWWHCAKWDQREEDATHTFERWRERMKSVSWCVVVVVM